MHWFTVCPLPLHLDFFLSLGTICSVSPIAKENLSSPPCPSALIHSHACQKRCLHTLLLSLLTLLPQFTPGRFLTLNLLSWHCLDGGHQWPVCCEIHGAQLSVLLTCPLSPNDPAAILLLFQSLSPAGFRRPHCAGWPFLPLSPLLFPLQVFLPPLCDC